MTGLDPMRLYRDDFLVDPYPVFARLRATEPVYWNPVAGAWFVTRHDDVVALLGDPRLGARDSAAVVAATAAPDRAAVAEAERFFSRWPGFTDGLDHAAVRRLIRPSYTPAAVAGFAPVIRRQAAAAARDLAGGADPVATANAYALAVTTDHLGFDDRSGARRWSAELLAYLQTSPVDRALARRTVAVIDEFTRHVHDVVLPAGRGPLARQVGAAVAAGEIDEVTAAAVYAQLLTGGVQPVATAVVASVTAPRDGAPADEVVGEALRHRAPFHFAPRVAAEDVPCRDVVIGAGQRVALVLAAANRDPQVHADPDRFCPGRARSHLAFGHGRHRCVGAHLAQVAVVAVLTALDELAPGLRIDPARIRHRPAAGATLFETADDPGPGG